ncbi:hypothetical protein BCS37_03230 [Selenomonas sp. oral taxon 920]|uniref:hypothetical protein n=1 Tax=Selenomonas sp. oral taxon 920 TaxID=1884263 RepID=UPI000840BCCF|nr:hypothetical protein [Selenomonas sp. oral taxon 920]AOH47519.1 hypothetical protein BCS37_03230 [Selenomonas sp. oral taxon 920]
MKFRALLLALTLVITVSGTAAAAVTEHRESTTNLSIAYPVLTAADGVVADPINADIAALAGSVRAAYESGAFYRGELGYRVHLDDENFLSVTFTDLRYDLRANQPTRRDYGYVYYKKTGQRLPLAFFVHITPTDLDAEAVNGHLYNEQGRNTPIQPEKSVHEVPTNYFLGGRGYVCPIFQAGELTASTGPTYVLLDASVIDYFNRKNK